MSADPVVSAPSAQPDAAKAAAVRRTLLVEAVVDDPVLLERVVSAAEHASDPAGPAGRRPSYAWPIFLGVVGSAVASRKAARSGHRRWPYWAVGIASTGFLGWALLTVMPAAMGRGEHARSIYGTIPREDEPDSYVPQGVPGVTDVPDTHEERRHGPPTAVDLEPPSYESSV